MAITKTLRTYRFMDKDPVKDELQTMLQDTGLFTKEGLKKVAILANLSYSTLDNLFYGDTRKPQNATVMGIATSIGYERVFRKVRKLNIEEELEFAKAWNKKEQDRLDKLRAKQPRKRKTKSNKAA